VLGTQIIKVAEKRQWQVLNSKKKERGTALDVQKKESVKRELDKAKLTNTYVMGTHKEGGKDNKFWVES